MLIVATRPLFASIQCTVSYNSKEDLLCDWSELNRMHCAGYCIPQCNGSASPLIHSSVLEVKILFIIFSILELIFNINLESFKSRTTVSYEVVN